MLSNNQWLSILIILLILLVVEKIGRKHGSKQNDIYYLLMDIDNTCKRNVIQIIQTMRVTYKKTKVPAEDVMMIIDEFGTMGYRIAERLSARIMMDDFHVSNAKEEYFIILSSFQDLSDFGLKLTREDDKESALRLISEYEEYFKKRYY